MMSVTRRNPGSEGIIMFRRQVMLLIVTVFMMTNVLPADVPVESQGIYRLVKNNLPKTIHPGQQLKGKMSVKVIQPGTPMYRRPFAQIQSQVNLKNLVRLSADKMNPYTWPTEQKPGDILEIGFTMDVPMDFPEGEAEITSMVTRNVPGKGWQYATVQDENGRDFGRSRFTWPVTVVRKTLAFETQSNAAVPIVVGRMTAPKMDGRVNATEWKGAGHIKQFVEANGDATLKAQTSAWIGHDDKQLYIAFVCDESKMDLTKRTKLLGHDGAAWGNECVELFISPEANSNYMQFIVDILNQHFDALGPDSYGYNPRWQSVVHEESSLWSVEIAIPFLALTEKPPKPGALWRANLCRERQVEKELSAWQPTYGGFSSPNRFGAWVFGSLKANLLLEAEALSALEIKGWPVELKASLSSWGKARQALQRGIAALDETTVQARYTDVVGEIKGLDRQYAQLQMKAMRLKGVGFTVTQADPFEVFNGKPLSTEPLPSSRDVTILRGEWIDLAWDLQNMTDRPMTVRCTTRYSMDDKQFNYLRLGIPGVETLWQYALPVAAGDGRPIYDAIVPSPAGTVQIPAGETAQVWLSLHAPNDAKAREQVARIVFEPIDGTKTEPVESLLNVQVVPVKLTGARSLHVFAFNWHPDEVANDPAWFKVHLEDLRSHGVDVCLISGLRHLPRPKADARGNLIGEMDFSNLDYLLDIAEPIFDQFYVGVSIWEKGELRRDFIGLDFWSPAYAKAFKTRMAAVIKRLLAHGLTYDRFMINPYDESVGEECQMIAGWIKEVDPKVRIVIDSSTPDLEVARKIDVLTDIWIPHYKYFFPDHMQPFNEFVRATKKPYGFYYYSLGNNEKAQDPTRPYLTRFWWAFERDLKFYGRWAEQYYGDPWYRVRYSKVYEAALIYPTEGGVIPSRRWQAWRQGWQDHCLLSLARKLLQQAGDETRVAALEEMVHQVVAVPGDPRLAEGVRKWCKDVILETR